MSRDLNHEEIKRLNYASREAVGDVYEELEKHWQNNRWLDNNNVYSSGNIAKNIKNDLEKHRWNSFDLSQIIVSSALIHSMDGWSYLGNSLMCYARGDVLSAVHLAYYAELRAALSILASEGIGIFNDVHFAIKSKEECISIVMTGNTGLDKYTSHGTHHMVWNSLENWANSERSWSLIGNIIEPFGIKLDSWLEKFHTGTPQGRKLVGNDLFNRWGLDLKRLSEDRDSRGLASYQPSDLNRIKNQPVSNTVEYIKDFWEIFEPSNGPFMEIDKYLLRKNLEIAFKAKTGSSIKQAPKKYETILNSMLNSNIDNEELSEYVKQFLTKDILSDDPILFTDAVKDDLPFSKNHHTQVISRATLLLRIATGACSYALKTNDKDFNDLTFWWDFIGETRGLWESGKSPTNLNDLWVDVEDILEDFTIWEQNNSNSSSKLWHDDNGHHIFSLGKCERIGLWGLAA